MTTTPELLWNFNDSLGEGPAWDQATRTTFWIDSHVGRVNGPAPESGAAAHWDPFGEDGHSLFVPSVTYLMSPEEPAASGACSGCGWTCPAPPPRATGAGSKMPATFEIRNSYNRPLLTLVPDTDATALDASGVKQSEFGREGGRNCILEFLDK